MKNRFKQTLAVLTAVLMLICMLPAGIFAEGEDIPINETTFPDANFRAYVSAYCDTDNSGALSQDEIAEVTSINVNRNGRPNGDKISDLTGIGYFTALDKLWCSWNQLAGLDVSNNTALQELHCENNQLEELDVSNNTALQELHCENNQLTQLDVSQTALTELWCRDNQLTNLDVSNNTALTRLDCGYNQLTQLDVSMLIALTELLCHNNQLTNLDVSNNTALTKLSCGRNQLTQLDVSMLIALTELGCYNNQLTSLDVSNNTALTDLVCAENQLTSLNVRNNTALRRIECHNSQLTELDVSNNTALKQLGCGWNQLTSMDVNNNTALTNLNCDNNQLTELNVSNNHALTWLDCMDNQLTALDVSNNRALKHLDCRRNQLTELNVSNNHALTYFACINNQLTQLDVSENTELTTLMCSSNHLTNLDLSANTALSYFQCDNNQYTVYSNPFDLTTLPGNFVTDNASNWQGGTVDGNMLTFNVREATYTYDCGNNLTAGFKLLAPEDFAPPAPDGMGTITVVNPQANKTYNAYRVFDLTYSPANAPVNYAYSIQGGSPWFDVIQDYANNHDNGLRLTPSAADPDLYVVEFASEADSIPGYGAFDPVDFAMYLRDNQSSVNDAPVAWRESGSTPTGPIRLTTDGNVPNSEFDNIYVPLGYYFVNTGNGTFCGLDSTDPDAYIYDKYEVPGWDMQSGNADLSGKVVAAKDPYADENPGSWGRTSDETIGSEAWFKIMAHVPAYEYGHQVEQYTFTDTLDNGFTYDAGSLKITLYPGLDADTGAPIGTPQILYDSAHTTVQGVDVELPGTSNTITVELQLTGNGAIANYYPDAHIVIEYTAHVDQDAVHDNVNTANMNWIWVDSNSNPVPNPPPEPTPELTEPAIPADVHTHTYVYGLPFNKTIKDSDPVAFLPGAEFELYRDEACSEKINLVVDNDLPEGAPIPTSEWNYYRVADAAETAGENFASETIKAGRAVIWGLAPGTYYLLETKAPDGYNPLADPFPITICAVDNLETTEINEDNVGDNGYVTTDTFNVENAAGAELPGVGGIGTKIFYIVGALLMIAAAVLLVVRKKMSVQE